MAKRYKRIECKRTICTSFFTDSRKCYDASHERGKLRQSPQISGKLRHIASYFQTLDVTPSPPSCEIITSRRPRNKQHRDRLQDDVDDDNGSETIIAKCRQIHE